MRKPATHPGEVHAAAPSMLRYGVAAAAALVATAVRLALNPVVGPYAPYLPLVLAVIITARYSGSGPALAATALSAASAWYFFLEPRNSFGAPYLAAGANLLVFVATGAVISFLVGRLPQWTIASVTRERVLARQAQLIDLSHDAIIIVDANRVIQAWNTGATEMYGWSDAEAIGQVIDGFLNTRNHLPMTEIRHMLARDGRWEGELIHTGRAGREIIVESRHVLVRDESGAPSGFLEINRDITERKKAEIALRESERRVQRKLESVLSPDMDVGQLELEDVIDVEAIQSVMNDLWEFARLPMAILDTSGKVLVGVGWQEICTRFHRIHPETLRHCIESDTCLTEGVPAGQFKLYQCKNNLCDVATPLVIGGQHLGNIFTGQFLLEDEPVSVPLFSAKARTYGFDEKEYLSALDRVPRIDRRSAETAISFLGKFGAIVGKLSYANIKLARSLNQLRRSKEEILQLNATLERRVEERTAELQQANRELESFSYSVSHDLRAPLRTVEGFSKILLRDYRGKLLDETAAGYMQRMSAASKRMGQLIEDLLALSRLSRQEMTCQWVDLSQIVHGILNEYRLREPDRDVEDEVEPGVTAHADPKLARIVLENLVGNAWKYTGRTAAASIAFGAHRNAGAPVFFVRDNGAGFDMAHAEQLFAPFQRLHRQDEFEGNGIGLATVQRVVRRHGGRVWAEAEPGRGAVFYFTLGEP